MQNIIIPLKINGVKGVIVTLPSGEVSRSDIPALTKNMACIIRLRLMQDDGTTKYNAAELENIISWYFIMAHDWDKSTPSQIKTYTNISLDATGEYTDLVIALSADDTNSGELNTDLGNNDEKSYKVELGGYESDEEGADADFVLQLDALSVRNRLESTEDPTSLPETYWTIPETKAYVGAAPDFQFSVDGATLWHDTQVDADRYYRESRNGGDWSDAIALVVPSLAGYCEKYPPDGPFTFTKADVDSGTKLLAVPHNLGQKWGLSVSTYSEDSGKQIDFDEIIPVDNNNLNIDCTNKYDDMTGNYYYQVRK